MKSLFILTITFLLGLSSVLGQEKNIQSGNVLFHTIAKKSIKANATIFESKLNLSSKNISFVIPFQNFKTKSSSLESQLKGDENIVFKGEISANSNLDKEGRHIVFVKGELTIMGETKPFEFNGVLVNRSSSSNISASFLVNGKDFGLNDNLINEFAEKVEVSLSATY